MQWCLEELVCWSLLQQFSSCVTCMKRPLFKSVLFVVLVFCATGALAQQRQSARSVPGWVRDGVIYEIYPRAFSQQGNFNAITARLDELKDLGVTILWLMPIHPIGQEKKKGSI